MDSTDLKIISMLKKNARVSASAIAKEVGLAVSSVTVKDSSVSVPSESSSFSA